MAEELIIGYLTEVPQLYSQEIKGCITAKELVEVIAKYEIVAADALEIAKAMTEEQFEKEFLPGRVKENKGEFAGEEWYIKYNFIMMPDIMFRVAITADQFHCPWGTAYHQMKNAKLI